MEGWVISILQNVLSSVVVGLAVWLWDRRVIHELRRRLSAYRPRSVDLGSQVAFKMKRQGIVFTIGLHSAKPNSVVHTVMQHLKPEYVGFMGSEDTEGVIQTLMSDLRLDREKVKTELTDITDVAETKTKAGILFDWMVKQGLAPAETVLDITGGTATMSIAAFIAAEERQIDSQYIYSQFDPGKNMIVPGSQKPILVTHYEGANASESPAIPS